MRLSFMEKPIVLPQRLKPNRWGRLTVCLNRHTLIRTGIFVSGAGSAGEFIFRSAGADQLPAFTHGLRRELHSCAALRGYGFSFMGGDWKPALRTVIPTAAQLTAASAQRFP
jgi:hypothetical protein